MHVEKEALRQKRKDLGYTQSGLAGQLGVTVTTVARWERGEQAIPPYLELALKAVPKEKKVKK